MRILQTFRKFKKSLFSYTPVIGIVIYRDHILHNLAQYRKVVGMVIAPVIKSNAYGHGLVHVARILEKTDIPFLVVDSLFEANQLLAEGVKTPILIIGYTPTANIRTAKRSTAFTIGSLEQLHELALGNLHTKIHLKIDTGMHRQGIMQNEIDTAIDLLKNSSLQLEGVCSHLADAENDDPTATLQQITAWNSASTKLKTAFPDIQYRHVAASAGIGYSDRIDANILRLGIGLYGIDTRPRSQLDLKPALEMHASISALRTLEAGEKIGYGGTFVATRPTRAATVPVGYYEGVDRRLSNNGEFRVRGISAPILGRVSMNITSIDVTNVPDAQIGESVEIISADPSHQNSIENIAKRCDTIPYEILIHIPAHLSRNIA